MGIWIAQRLDPGNPEFNIAEYLEIFGPVDPRLFEMALRRVVLEADALRLRVIDTDLGPRQYVDADLDWVMPFIDVSAETDPRAAAETWMQEDTNRVVNLSGGPLFGFALFRASRDCFFWYYRYHHICADGASHSLVARRVAGLYSDYIEGGLAEIEDPGSWFDLLKAESDYRLSAQFMSDREFWHEHLADRPEPVTLSGKPPSRSRHFIRRTGYLPRPVAERLRTQAKTQGASLPQLITTAATLLLHRLTGARDLILGIPLTARVDKRMRRIPGMVANVLPVRFVIDPERTFVDLLRNQSQCMYEVLRHHRYRGEDLRRELGLHPGDPAMYGTVVNFLPFDYNFRFAGHRIHVRNVGNWPVDDLAIVVSDRRDDSDFCIDFYGDPDHYTTGALAEHQQRFLGLLNQLVIAAPDLPLFRLEVLGPGERQTLLEAFNATSQPLPEGTLPGLFEPQVEAHARCRGRALLRSPGAELPAS